MKQFIAFACMMGIFVLIGAMGYYNLVLIPEMRHKPSQIGQGPGLDAPLQ